MYYRKYECNLETYYLKALKGLESPVSDLGDATVTSLAISSMTLTPSGVTLINGVSPLNTTHTLTSTELPPLAQRECNGEITLFLNNDLYTNVTLAIIIKSADTILQTLIYQRVGNFTSVELAHVGDTITVTCSPAGTLRWIYRGL